MPEVAALRALTGRSRNESTLMTTKRHVVAVLAVSLVGVALLGASASSAPLAAGTVNLQATLGMVSLDATLTVVADPFAPCPPGSPDSLVCPALTGQGPAPGLGMVTQTASERLRVGPPSCNGGDISLLGYPVRWVVGNKGEITFVTADSAECIAQGGSASWKQAFTVTGGTGIYEGASGSGTRTQVANASSNGTFRGVETWTGTLSVPGLDFDTAAPTISGATSKTVRAPKRAKSVRVTYKVTASDNADSQVPVTCLPRSGSRFPIGRTIVKCSATDSSANTAKAAFRITVRPTR